MTPSVGWLPFLSAFTLAFAVFTYVVLDGTDLGVGVLFAVDPKDRDREVMVDSILPIWDGNETWLVLGGGGLIGMFPAAYSALLTALYPVLIVMLMALIFRGVTIEFRSRSSPAARPRWDKAMFAGSATASFCQGVVLGAFIQGIRIEKGVFAGGWWDWLSSFSVLCGIALTVGYALLGACWLVWRTDGELQQRSQRHARILMLATLGFIVAVSVWTPLLREAYAQRWFAWPNILLVSPVPILLALCAGTFWWTLARGYEVVPLIAALACFLLCYVGFGISVYPNIIPPSFGIPEAASARSSQIFALIGSAILIPAILAYSTYSFWIFRGKVEPRGPFEQQHGEHEPRATPAADSRSGFHAETEIRCGIRKEMEQRIARLSHHPAQVHRRLEQLDREWDIQRGLTAGAASLAVASIFLGRRRNRAGFILAGLAVTFGVQQAYAGWSPLYPILRQLGFRTAEEIERERAGVEALRRKVLTSETGPDPSGALSQMKRELAEAGG